MNDFAFNLNLAPHLFEPETAASLAACLSSFHKAGDGHVTAIFLCYSDAFPGPLRDEGPGFVMRRGDGVEILSYGALSPLVQPGLADAVLRLEDDAIFGQHLREFVHEMRHEDDDNYHHLVVTSDAVAFYRPDVAQRGYSGWTEERLERFCRFLCREAGSAHEAIGRHDDLEAQTRLWRTFIDAFQCSNDPLPSLRGPTVGELLPKQVGGLLPKQPVP